MYAHCIVVFFALLIPLSFGLVTVNAPTSAIACDPVQFTWQGGIGPWLLSILSESPPNPALENLGSSAAPPFTWVVDAKLIGTTVFLSVQDSTGDSGQSSSFTIVHPGLGSACGGSDSTSGGGGGGGVSTNSTAAGGDGSGGGNGTGSGDGNGSGDGSGGGGSSSPTNTGSSTGGGETSPPPRGGSQGSSPQGGSQAPDSTSSSSAQNPPSSPTSTSSPSTSSSPSSTTSPTESPAAFNFNTASGSSSASSTNSLSSPTFTLSNDVSGLGGQIQPASSVVQSGVSSTGITQDGASNNSFTKKNVMSGAIIGGIIAAVIVVLLGAFCVLRWCRRRRLNAPDTLSYPFSHTGTEASGSTPREMVGRSGYPASTFSSWGNHGDLDERAVSPSEGHSLWEAGQGTIESRYQAAFGFTPGHASSSSIDRNDPSPQAQQRFRSRGPIPKSMNDARQAGPSDSSTAIMSEQPYTAIINEGPPAHTFDEIRPQAMPSWGTAHDMMAGRHPVVAGYPPPYTSK